MLAKLPARRDTVCQIDLRSWDIPWLAIFDILCSHNQLVILPFQLCILLQWAVFILSLAMTVQNILRLTMSRLHLVSNSLVLLLNRTCSFLLFLYLWVELVINLLIFMPKICYIKVLDEVKLLASLITVKVVAASVKAPAESVAVFAFSLKIPAESVKLLTAYTTLLFPTV